MNIFARPVFSQESSPKTLEQRIRWRCRRGMNELDQLLQQYLQHGWPQADAAERDTFLQLLECEDVLLWPWFMGREQPEDPAMQALVGKIRDLAVNLRHHD